MAMIELSMVIGAIVEMGVEGVWQKAKRREIVIGVLKKLGLAPDRLPSDFDGVYAYTLVEYGVGKPKPILDFFRHEFIRNAFHQSFEQRDASILDDEAESLIEWHKVGDDLRRMDIDPRPEFARFTAVFNEIVDRTRTPAEVRRDQKLNDIYGDLHQKTGEIIERLERLDALDEIRAELARLAQSFQARQFVVVPSGDRLKVFISSKLTELRDVREFVAKAVGDRGIDAWVYEARAGARPEGVVETSLREVEAADIYVGLFWQKYGQVTVQEYRHARASGKPCFVYIRDKDIQREHTLENFLKDEVYDLHKGVAYDYFDGALKLGQQVANDIMAWLVRRHREMTAEIQAARISREQIARLKAEVERLQAATRERLPQGTPADYLAQQMRAWFGTLGYGFESHDVRAQDHFEWIINIPTRRGYDRILVRGIKGEAEIGDIAALRQAVDKQGTDEGWLVAPRRTSRAAREEVEKKDNRDLFCYAFDELLDEHADFSGYLDWLETEVKRQRIDRMYVPLACTKEELDSVTNRVRKSHYDKHNGWIDGYIDRWVDDPSKEHMSILGEFGTGKTWFALHFAWTALQRYREARKRGVQRPRLPLVIPLRDYAKAVSVESLFSEFFFRKHEIPLPGYSAFEQLNRMGKLLLIFDGFDEMATKVDRQKMINNFWELAQVVVPGSKAILTCRTEHFPEAKEGRALLSAKLQASTAQLTGEAPQFEVLELEPFDDDQIRRALSLRAEAATVELVMDHRELLELARRPLMSELILEALPDIEAGRPVDLSRVHLYAVRRKMDRDIKAKRTFTSLADKLYFLCELSWEMLSTGQMSLNYRLFPDRLRRLFGHAVQEQKDLDHWHYDMMGQTMLIRNADGDYTPPHRSLLEFFVAYKFCAELGVLAPDFSELAQLQSNLDMASSPQDYTWSSWFRREVDQEATVRCVPPLRSFAVEEMDRLAGTVGKQPLTPSVLGLMGNMLGSHEKEVKERLLATIDRTRGKTGEEVGVVGGNVATLLVRRDQLALKGRKLPTVNLDSGDLSNADLSGCNLRFASLQRTRFRATTLENADLTGADLTHSQFIELGAVYSVVFSPDALMLVSGGQDTNVRVWDTATGVELYALHGHTRRVNSVCWNPSGDQIASGGDDGRIVIWEFGRHKLFTARAIHSARAVTCVRFLPEEGDIESYIAWASGNAVWKWNDLSQKVQKLGELDGDGKILCLAVDPLARWLAFGTGHFDHTLGSIDIATGQMRLTTGAHHRDITALRFHPAGETLLSASQDWSIATWNPADLRCLSRIQTTSWIKSAALFEDGKFFAIGRGDGALVFFSLKHGKYLFESQKHSATVEAVDASDTAHLLVTGSSDASIRLWDARPFVDPNGEPHINIAKYTPPNLSTITDDPATWPGWWQECKIDVPDGMMPNPDFGKCLRTIEQRLNCQGLRVAGAKGLDVEALTGAGTLGTWLAERGAIL